MSLVNLPFTFYTIVISNTRTRASDGLVWETRKANAISLAKALSRHGEESYNVFKVLVQNKADILYALNLDTLAQLNAWAQAERIFTA